MYIPKVKYKVGGKLNGKLIDVKTGRQYLGEFVQDYNGIFYKGNSINSSSEILEFKKDNSQGSNEVLGLRFIYRKPSPKDYDRGYFTRYFVKDNTSSKVVEVDRPKYFEIRKQQSPVYSTTQLDWIIKGPFEDYVTGGYKAHGVRSRNTELIKEYSKILPGLGAQVLKDPLEFVVE